MMMFYNAKLVVLAQTKCGSTALARALQADADLAILSPPRMKHTSARRYRRNLEPWVTKDGAEEFDLFALIREPIDWLGSWYRYRQRPDLVGDLKSTQGVSFDEFVTAWMSDERPDFARVGSQSAFLTGGRGRLLVPHLYRYEAFDAALSFLAARLGRPIAPPRVNVSPKFGLALSSRVEADLRSYAARDFQLWDGARSA